MREERGEEKRKVDKTEEEARGGHDDEQEKKIRFDDEKKRTFRGKEEKNILRIRGDEKFLEKKKCCNEEKRRAY